MYKVVLMDKNISTLLGEVKAATKWSEHRLAEELGTSQPTVNRILNGQDECKGSTFRAITDLHARQCLSKAAKRRRRAGEKAATADDVDPNNLPTAPI